MGMKKMIQTFTQTMAQKLEERELDHGLDQRNELHENLLVLGRQQPP